MDNTIIQKKPSTLSLIWDLLTIIMVILNLSLLLFDLSYLRLRPHYYHFFPKALQLYDPILGIEEHRMTHDYLKYVKELRRIENFKDKSLLEAEMNSLEASFEKDLFQTLEEKAKEEIQIIQTQLEAIRKLSNQTEQLNARYEIYKQALKKFSKFISFQQYTDLNNLLSEIEKLYKIQSEGGRKELLDSILQKMDFQMVMIVEDNPFVQSGQIHLYKSIQQIIKEEYNKNITPEIDEKYRKLLEAGNYTRKKVPSTAVAFAWFWRDENRTLEEKLNFFNEKLYTNFDLNYYRVLDMSGKPMSRFWELDLPFYIFFFVEFFVSWFVAIRRKTFIAWFFYPIYHWYDAIALIPLAEVRVVRLLRLYSMYLILQSRDYYKFGNDIITRTLRYYSNIIKEELSDMVTIQILTDAQLEIRSGSSMEVLTNALNSNKEQIKEVMLAKLADPAPIERVGNLVKDSLRAIFQNPNSSVNFLPNDLKEKLATEVVEGIIQIITKGSKSISESEIAKESVGRLVDFILAEITESAKDERLNKLNQDITIELLENIKKQVAVKKWLDTSI